jgi:hypothetical protein
LLGWNAKTMIRNEACKKTKSDSGHSSFPHIKCRAHSVLHWTLLGKGKKKWVISSSAEWNGSVTYVQGSVLTGAFGGNLHIGRPTGG